MKRTALVLALLATAALATGPDYGPIPEKPLEVAAPLYVFDDGGSWGLSIDAGALGSRVEAASPLRVYNDGGSYGVSLSLDGGLIPVSGTTADVTLYVDPIGNDANACTASGSAACATIQGALNKMPKWLTYRGTLNVACGNYKGFVASDFSQDNGEQRITGGMLLSGTWAAPTLASGTASGTVTSTTARSGSTWATVTDNTQAWQVDALVGDIFRTGTRTTDAVISSNTATTITIVGNFTAPANGTAYSILDSCSVINASTPNLPTATLNTDGGPNLFPVIFTGNNMRNGGLQMEAFKISVDGGFSAVGVLGCTFPTLRELQIVAQGTNQAGVFCTNSYGTNGIARSYIKSGTTASGTLVSSCGNQLAVSDTLLVNGFNSSGCVSGFAAFSGVETRNSERGIEIDGSCYATLGPARLGGTAASGEWCVEVAERHDGATAGGSAQIFDTALIPGTCAIGVEMGGGFLDISTPTGLSGSATTYVLNVRGGAKVTAAQSAITATGGSFDINMNSGDLQLNFSDLLTLATGKGGCAWVMRDGTSVCKR